MWCDGGGRHWWVLTTWAVVVVCGRIISICGQSFSNMGGRSRTWVVVTWWWWWRSAMASLSTWLPHRCQRHGTWLPCQQRKWGGCVCFDCRDGLEVLTWGWTQHCHRQMSIDVPHRRRCLPLTCCLLTWCSCIVRMVYWCVQVVVGGGRWQWCGDDGWCCGWWWWWSRKEVVVC